MLSKKQRRRYKWAGKLPTRFLKTALYLIFFIEKQEDKFAGFKKYGSATRELPGGHIFFDFWLWLNNNKFLDGVHDCGGSTYVDNLGVCDTLGCSWEQGRFCGCHSEELGSEYWVLLPFGFKLIYYVGCGDGFYLHWNPWKNKIQWKTRKGTEEHHRHETEDAI